MITLQDIARLIYNLGVDFPSPEINCNDECDSLDLDWYKGIGNNFCILLYADKNEEDRLGWAGLVGGEKIYGSVPFQTEVPEIVKEALVKLFL